MRTSRLALTSLLALHHIQNAICFSPIFVRAPSRKAFSLQAKASTISPSRVQDDDGPTPPEQYIEPEEVDIADIPGFNYDRDTHPISFQPWRRGDTDGCEDPIEAQWRLEGESIIRNAVTSVGATVRDVTWFMAAVVVTLEDETDDLQNVQGESGPEIRVTQSIEPQYFDPDDPEPEDDYGWYAGEEDGRVATDEDEEEGLSPSGVPGDPFAEREFDETTGTYLPPPERPPRDAAVRNMSTEEFGKYVSDGMTVQMIDRDNRIKKKLNIDEFNAKLEELRETTDYTFDEIEKKAKELRATYLKSADLAEFYPEEFDRVGLEEELSEKLAMPLLEREDGVDTFALSIIAKAIITALEDDEVEDSLEILSRHEIILTSPGAEDEYVETQRQFDERKGEVVMVQTQDPFGSNRMLTGRLVDRNALDIVINVSGRMVTLPMNMVAHVEIPKTSDQLAL